MSTSTVDVKQFLSEHKLSDALDIFVKRDISIEELMEFDNSELRQFAKDIGLDTLQQTRLVNGIKALRVQQQPPGQPTNTVSDTIAMYRPSPIVQVIVSAEEQKAIAKFSKLYNNTQLIINNLQASFNILEQNASQRTQDLNSLYAEMIEMLQAKRKSLLSNLQTVQQEKQRLLVQQVNELKAHSQNLNAARMEYEALVSNPTLDLKYRKKQIKKIMQKMEQHESTNKFISEPYFLATQPNVGVDKSQFEQLKRLLLHNISISSFDFPGKPMVTVKKATDCYISVKWSVQKRTQEALGYDTLRINRFELQYVQCNEQKEAINTDKLAWKSVHIDGDKHSYKITELQENTQYFVRVRAENNNGYGRFSDALQCNTNELRLVWDKSNHGNSAKFESKTRVSLGPNQCIAVCKYKVDSKDANVFSWEIKCHTISNYSWIGFVRYPATSTVTNWNYFLGGLQFVYSIGFQVGSTTASINATSHHTNSQSFPLTKAVQLGDVFRFKVNWKKKCVDIYHNGKQLKLNNGRSVFENLNETAIVPAVSNNTSLATYTIRCPQK